MPVPRGRGTAIAAVAVAVVSVVVLARGGAVSARAVKKPADPNWVGFGRTSEETRHSPLTQITRSNVGQLGRVFTVSLLDLDPKIKKGQQSFPVVVNGVIYFTSGDDEAFAVDATTGKLLWHFRPPNRALFRNFGIVANRGLAYCDGKLFLLTLDMHINAISPRTGRLLKRVAIADAVPGAASNYGYSETSAPICGNHTLVVGAAGSEYGVRGFVMGYHTDLTPAWANPYWTVPPEQQSWRRFSRLAGGGVVWTPTTIDRSTNTLYFGTGSATPLYFPQFRPGLNPRTDSLIALDLRTGKQRWWRQLLVRNEWAYDVAQPPLVYTGRVGGKRHRVVSVATMEGVWFAFDARTGRPFHQRVKVIDRVEHPSLRPGKAVTIFPSSLGGLNFSPASYDPATNYIFNAAAETAAVLVQSKLTATERKRKRTLGDIFLGLQNGEFGSELQGWHDHGSISAIDVSSGRRVWKFRTPEPERGGVATTASGLGFAGGGDGVLRAFDVRNGKVLWKFQTGAQIASGTSIYRAGGKEYIAITVGGTPTSSGGGFAKSELQVFGLGGSKTESPPPKLPGYRRPQAPPEAAPSIEPVAAPAASKPRLTAAAPGVSIRAQTHLYVRGWRASDANYTLAQGRLLYRGSPVAGAKIRVDGFVLPGVTDRAGRFFYRADMTMARRHTIAVVGAGGATVKGKRVPAAARSALVGARGGFSVGYVLRDLRARPQRDGSVRVTGRVTYRSGRAAPTVVLYTYQLRGTITGADGKPVAGATVVTRTLDRDFWTFSQPSDAQGHYISFFGASDEAGSSPVPYNVQVANGDDSFTIRGAKPVTFDRLRSAVMDLRLPASGTVIDVPKSTSYAGAVYEGLLVGVSGPSGVVRPLSARWPDAGGRFSLVLPRSVRGHAVSFWENQRQFFSRTPARAGGRVDLGAWPTGLLPRVPQGLATLRIPG